MHTDSPPLSAHSVALDIPIAASRDRVWRSLVEDIGQWWHEDFFVTTGDRRLTLEAHVGGRLFEESEAGAGLLWYTVTAIDPGRSIHLVGHLQPPFGGPATSMLHLSLEDNGEGTLFRLTDHSFGVVGESASANTESGWRQLFEDGLKGFVEK